MRTAMLKYEQERLGFKISISSVNIEVAENKLVNWCRKNENKVLKAVNGGKSE